MKNHLSEHQLVDHLFRLDDERGSRGAERHLADCSECRARRDALQQKFAALDVLRDETEAPEQLVADTLRRIRNDQPAGTVWFPRWAWGLAGAAATAVLLAVVWTGHPPQPQVMTLAKSAEAPVPAPEAARYEEKGDAVMEFAMDKPLAASVAAPAEAPVAGGEMLMAQAAPPASHAAKAMRMKTAPPDWHTYVSTPDATVEVTRQPPRTDSSVQEWRVTAANTGNVPAAVRLERPFAFVTWDLTTTASNVSITRSGERQVLMTFELAPSERREFECTATEAPPVD